ncbi:hypothetical protein CRE_09055 [Caenorhabditis remanei]|uniref:Uncharacterized protein n=1 Tax=Caenorhabditis remanei TaxID=31234 RepID=E3LJ40_CAERE|nr:hypothetical protein CRE_09055 [Caenorhabditis remanei]
MTSMTIKLYHFFYVILFFMISSLFIPTLLTYCSNVPPEDVSIYSSSATLSTTQASPITTAQCTASSRQTSTTTPVGVTPITVSPVTTTPATVTTTPVTMAPTLCTKCEIAAITPVIEANTVFENTWALQM